MPKVAIICGAGIVSGKEIMVLELAAGLREAGVELHIVTSRWGSGEFAKRSEAAGLPTSRMWLGYISATLHWSEIRMTLDQLRRWPALALAYLRFLREIRPQRIIHTNWHHTLLLWPFLRPERDILWLHEILPNKAQYRRFFQSVSHRMSKFIAVSNAVATSLKELAVPSSKIRLIYNGVSMSPIAGPNSFERPLRVGIVGQIGPWKGHEDLIRAFQIVIASEPETQLYVFGQGSKVYEDYLKQIITELKLEHNVFWQGFVAQKEDIYSTIDILVAPSRYEEPFGLTPVEAGSFGLPVIASKQGGLQEIIRHGETGLLFEPGDIGQLAESIIEVLKDSERRRIMGQEGMARVTALFGKERFVHEFLRMLQRSK
jgi:glycosyltransferase involved in cell wall biosynthesis